VVDIPETVRRKALAVGAAQWLTALPALVSCLERDWSISVGRAYEDATEAFVAEAVVEGVAPAVLKLLVPRDGDAASNEITVLRLTDGAGCVRLLRHDAARGALLLERLGASPYELALPKFRRHEILCSVATGGGGRLLIAHFRPAPTRAAGSPCSLHRPGRTSVVLARSGRSTMRSRVSLDG